MKVTFTCIQLTTQMINGKITYSAQMQYPSIQGTNVLTLNSDTPINFVVGQTYTAALK